MKLGDIIKSYRERHGFSQRRMADLIGCSYTYVGMLEKGINSKTKKPVSPTIDFFKRAADAMCMDLDTLLKSVDTDQPIIIPAKHESKIFVTDTELEHIEKYRALTEAHRNVVNGLTDDLYKMDTENFVKKESPSSGPGEADAG